MAPNAFVWKPNSFMLRTSARIVVWSFREVRIISSLRTLRLHGSECLRCTTTGMEMEIVHSFEADHCSSPFTSLSYPHGRHSLSTIASTTGVLHERVSQSHSRGTDAARSEIDLLLFFCGKAIASDALIVSGARKSAVNG